MCEHYSKTITIMLTFKVNFYNLKLFITGCFMSKLAPCVQVH